MGLLLLRLFVFGGFVCVCLGAKETTLWVGNSYTSVHNLPETFMKLYLSDTIGTQASKKVVTKGGQTLSGHCSTSNQGGSTLSRYLSSSSEKIDRTILQDQSQIPSFQPVQVQPAVCLATKSVEEKKAPVFFYQTWGRRAGDSWNPGRNPDFLTMQQNLIDGYNEYCQAVNDALEPPRGHKKAGYIAPVGEAWRLVYKKSQEESGEDPSTDSSSHFYRLFGNDGSHPSQSGTYLASCVFYAAMTGQSPIGKTYLGGISRRDAIYLQKIANETVFQLTIESYTYPWN